MCVYCVCLDLCVYELLSSVHFSSFLSNQCDETQSDPYSDKNHSQTKSKGDTSIAHPHCKNMCGTDLRQPTMGSRWNFMKYSGTCRLLCDWHVHETTFHSHRVVHQKNFDEHERQDAATWNNSLHGEYQSPVVVIDGGLKVL